jgi:hypothetical protein
MNKERKGVKKKGRKTSLKWHLMDLHLHTPASGDYQETGVSYLQILQQCDERNLEIVAFTDHNTVAGYRQMKENITQLEMLEQLGRQTDEERQNLSEYRRLLTKVFVLPGFEFTATLGFHILGIFPPSKSIRELEYLLLSLNIPADQLDLGSLTIGASTDVLTAYKIINEAGGLVIAAHANSTHGVAMRGLHFSGQTKIAYTQDSNLHALEVTDLEKKGRHSTAAFFNGAKPEYPRRMHCIQGSDAHRLRVDPKNPKNLGIGDRTTEVYLPEVSFDALKELFLSNDFSRTRPYRASFYQGIDFVQQAREEGPSIIQDFHEGMTVRGGCLYTIIAEVCAFANTNGGTLFIGLNANVKEPVAGIAHPAASVRQLEKEISNRITPRLNCQVDTKTTKGKKILRVLVPRGDDPPYAVDDNKIYVRSETETGLAVRDEIFQLVRRGLKDTDLSIAEKKPVEMEDEGEGGISPPRTGVEIVTVEERHGNKYFTMRDLRNGNVVKNVTKSSARRLWHYAILQYSSLPEDLSTASITWRGDIGLLQVQRRGKSARYDLAQKTSQGIRIYFGVTEDGIHGNWKSIVGGDND